MNEYPGSIILDLIKIAESLSNEIGDPIPAAAMRSAVEDGKPRGGGAFELQRFFGKHLQAASKQAGTVATAINEMVPGFVDWLNHTGFGDDKLMMLALIEIANGLARYRRPSDARMRPAIVPLPQHL